MTRETILDGLEPTDLGLPELFTHYRTIQREAADFAIYGPKGDGQTRLYSALGMPTGSGKTLAVETIGMLTGKRYCSLTANNGLLDQHKEQFDGIAADIRGRANYVCSGVKVIDQKSSKKVEVSCEQGQYEGCHLDGTMQCGYQGDVEKAKQNLSVSSNYAYWLNARALNNGALETPGKPIETLLCDEAHLAFDELCRFLSTYISIEDLMGYGRIGARKAADGKGSLPWWGEESGVVTPQWDVLLKVCKDNVAADLKLMLRTYGGRGLAKMHRDYQHAEKLNQKLTILTKHSGDGNWIWRMGRKGITFDCVWPYRYARQYLFQSVPKIVLVSATLRPKLLSLLGLKRSDVDFKEWPRQFPAHLSPVYYLDRKVRLKGKNLDDLKRVTEVVDEIVAARPGRKVLIHAVSYERAQHVKLLSKFRHRMLVNEPGKGNAMKAANEFRESDDSILISPSFTTGWDFADDSCEVNIILKVPFPDRSDPIVKARDSDPTWATYTAMQTIVQAAGRGTRHETDRCETFIVDGQINWFRMAGREYAPQWFNIRTVGVMPAEPAKL